jgi:hypothetical protein
MQRRLVSLGLILLSALGSVSLMRAIADNFDPAEKRCAQNMYRLGLALAMYLNGLRRAVPDGLRASFEARSRGAGTSPLPCRATGKRAARTAAGPGRTRCCPTFAGNRQSLHSPQLPCDLAPQAAERRLQLSACESPVPVSYTYNGYLHAYRRALVADPATLPSLLGRAGTRTVDRLCAREPDSALRPCRQTVPVHPVPRPEHDLPAGRSAPAPAVRVDPQERGSLHHAGSVAADPTVGRANRPE